MGYSKAKKKHWWLRVCQAFRSQGSRWRVFGYTMPCWHCGSSIAIQLVATECERRGKDFPQQLCVWVLRTEDDRIFSISFIVFDVTSNQFTCSQCCRTCPGGQLRSGGKECHGDQIFIHAADTDSFEPDLVAIQQTRSHTHNALGHLV